MGRLFGFVALFALTVFTVGCDDDNDGSGRNRVEWDLSKTVHPDTEGAAVLIVTGREGASWTAEIVSGQEWTSFDNVSPGNQTEKTGTVGPGLAAKHQFVYYWPNRTGEERHAMVRFTFDGAKPVELPLTQYSPEGELDVYQTGRDKVWPEIPAELTTNTGYVNVRNLMYVTHTALLNNGERQYNARNYTLCFDKSKFGAWWVAYPLHKVYTGKGRVETWAYDPKIEMQYQADLTKSYPARNYDRGHQIPNADRSANVAMQAQTFYFSNMTPQNSQLNQQPWGRLEAMARDNWMCSDTLYVVTGACWRNGVTTPDQNGKECPVPDYYFKVFVRTVDGNVRTEGDRLQDYSLKSIGFLVANNSGQGEPKSWVKSVKEIEDFTGFTFFPTVPADVKNQKNPSSWGL